MKLPTWAGDYPRSFPSHSHRPERRWVMLLDCFACRDVASGLEELQVVFSLPGEELTVYRGDPPPASSVDVRAVYSLGSADLPAVPTGRVFVQAEAPGAAATAGTSAGYAVESEPPYAPNSAWLVASDGSIATALRNLGALAEIEGVASVEPQMLRPATRRG